MSKINNIGVSSKYDRDRICKVPSIPYLGGRVTGELDAPALDTVDFGAVLAALADPLRRQVVVALLERGPGERACSSFSLPVAKSTRTHHWRVLREAGLIRQRDFGNGSAVRLRRDEIDERFPGLLDAVLAASGSP
jgi:DNA-binding transcriptional ArsR family regulator